MQPLTTLPFETETWPPVLAQIAPQAWWLAMLLGLLALAYFSGYLAKRLVRAIGRRIHTNEDQFLGSSWDLAAPVVQLLVFLAAFTGGAGQAGFNFGERLIGLWPRALFGVVIIAGAVMLASWLNRSLRSYSQRAHAQSKFDDTLISFSASVIRYVILGIAILIAMTQFGFAPGSLIAIVGAAGLAIALALQDTLKAVAAGFMLAAFRPFRVGDWVQIGDLEGEVLNITPFATSISQVDHKTVFLTNDKVWGNAILNHTGIARRRLNLFFDVHYDTDLDHALDVLKAVANAHERVAHKSDTWVGVHALGDWSISLRLRAWVPSREFVQIRSDITKALKQAFDREGIEIPYPHQVEYIREGITLKRAAGDGAPASDEDED